MLLIQLFKGGENPSQVFNVLRIQNFEQKIINFVDEKLGMPSSYPNMSLDLLYFLSKKEGGKCLSSDVNEAFGKATSAATRYLIDQKWIKSDVCVEDRRKNINIVTSKGFQIVEKYQTTIQEFLESCVIENLENDTIPH